MENRSESNGEEPRILFLPGAGGRRDFWQPVADRLPSTWERVMFGWPGFGGNPPDPAVQGMDGLLQMVLDELHRPAWLVAQSMGGVLAMQAALQRPGAVRGMVLNATSGGVDMRALGGGEWRSDYLAEFPGVPRWFVDDVTDVTDRLPSVTCPVLLIFGDADVISPVAVGEHLRSLLPSSELHVIAGGDHAFAHDRAEEVAGLVVEFLGG